MPAKVANPDRPLTVKQAKFAAAVANGVPKSVAHRDNYAADPKYPVAQRRKAAEVAATPNVAAEIRRLTWLSCPPLDDTRGMREHAVRVIADLSRSADTDTVRLNAALALYKIAETTLAAANPAASTTEQDKLLDRLRALYRSVQAQADRLPPSKRINLDPLPDLPVIRLDHEPIDITTLAESAPAAPAETPAGEVQAARNEAAAPPVTASPRWDQVSANSNISPQPAPVEPAEPPPAPPEDPPENIS